MPTSASAETFRFRDFELDVAGYELRRLGRPVRLGPQAMDVLILLVERRRQLVSRVEIAERLWGKDVFVDVETGVNTAVSKIRQALRDSAEAPAFVETIPAKGYRFIAPVEIVSPSPVAVPAIEYHVPSPEPVREPAQSITVLDRRSDLDSVEGAPARTVAGADAVSPLARARAHRALVIGLLVVTAATAFGAWRWLDKVVPASRVALAVLPFENLGSDPERAYLAAGLTEETSAALGQIDPDRLSVKGRTLHYKGTRKTAVEIGRELAVDYLLESTIRAEGARLRLTATLIRVRDQAHVWSQSYEREAKNLLRLQQELSVAIAEEVLRTVTPDRMSGLAGRQTQNAEAYDTYLRARYLESRRTAVTNAGAIEEYRHAIALDPGYALAWAGLAFTYASSTINGDAPPLELGPLARDAAAHAVEANPNLAEAQLAVGYVHWLLDWDWNAADAALQSAIRLDPSNAAGYRAIGHAHSQAGRHSEAEAAMRRTRELEPLEPFGYALSSQVAFQARQYPAAVDYARRAILIDSAFWIGSMMLGQAYEQIGEFDLALAALADAMRFSGGNSKATSLQGYILAKSGHVTEAREVLRTMDATAHQRYLPPFARALVYAGLGERAAVFEWLDRAYAARDVHLIYLPVDPKWDPYRDDPRFLALLARCGFTPRPKAPRR